ncbi:MAG: transporter substrate-binding domain-containing protein [Maritimibacter sp.]
MTTSRLRGVGIGLFASLMATAAAHADSLKIVTDANYAPMYMKDDSGALIGDSYELLNKAAAAAGIELTYEVVPFKRAVDLAEKEAGTCNLAFWRTEERDPNFAWVGPLAIDGIAVFSKAGAGIVINSQEDTFAYTTGVVSGWTSTNELEAAGHPKLDAVNDDTANVKKLGAGRIELWVSGTLSAPYNAGKAGVEVEQVFPISEVPLSLGCNLDTDAAVLESLQTALDAAKG